MSNQQELDAFFQSFQQRVQKVHENLAPIIGTKVVNHAQTNFKNEAFEGEKWPARKDKKNGKKLLVKDGHLHKSIGIVSSTPTSVTVGTDIPYARVHNDGGTINRKPRSETFVRNRHNKGKKKGYFKKGTTPGRGFTFRASSYNMPRRRFLGITPQLTGIIKETIKEQYDKEFPNSK